ncbi:MAG: hypothetical protein K9M57_03495, partial [Phycisphaerae bacterium]|nr:hypothetical protein [Phycisphaerae bacterium]
LDEVIRISPDAGGPEHQSLIQQAAETVSAKIHSVPPVALSLSGRYYQSQIHHSHFSDLKQLKQTLRYDIEEEFAIDAEAVALCYQQTPGTGNGIDLMVHTADRDQLDTLFGQFEGAELDALIAEPDVVSWQHYLNHQGQLPAGKACAVLGVGHDSAQMLFLDKSHQLLLARSFPCPDDDSKYAQIHGELRRSAISLADSDKPSHLIYHQGGLDDVKIVELAAKNALSCKTTDLDDVTEAFAAGVAIGYLNHQCETNFRSDNLMPRTLLQSINRSLYTLSVLTCLILLGWIYVMYSHTHQYTRNTTAATKELQATYARICPDGKKRPNVAKISKEVKGQLDSVIKRFGTRQVNTTDESASYAFILMMDMFNALPLDFDIKIGSLSIKPDEIHPFTGSVPDMEHLQVLRDTIKRPGSNLTIERVIIDKSDDTTGETEQTRRTFTFPLKVIK